MMNELINTCLVACEAQYSYCCKTRCTNSHEWPIFSCASDLIDYFLKGKIDTIKDLLPHQIDELAELIKKDDRFETFLGAKDDYDE